MFLKVVSFFIYGKSNAKKLYMQTFYQLFYNFFLVFVHN